MISSEQCISREMYHATDNGIKINRDSRIIDPTISVDFYPVPSCYPPVHFVSLWGVTLAVQRVGGLSLFFFH